MDFELFFSMDPSDETIELEVCLNLFFHKSLNGMICNCHFSKKETEFLELTKQTSNKFLKLVFFECLISSRSIGEQNRILNSEGLIPIYYEVAVNIVKQRKRRYRPMWLVKKYIKLSHKSRKQEMFNNVGNILKFIIADQNIWIGKKHIKEASEK